MLQFLAITTGAYLEPTKITIGDFLDQWLRDSVRSSVASTTYATYEMVVRRYLVPSLGAIRLPRQQPADIQPMIRFLLENGKADGQSGVAPASVLKAFAVLHRACKQAVRWGWLARNPCDTVDRHSLMPHETQVWMEDETRGFLDESRL